MGPHGRANKILLHLSGNQCAGPPPSPPTVEVEEGIIFPTFPQLLETRKRLGALFTYNIYGGHRMTFVADPAVWRLVFFAKGSNETKLESEKLAYVWFGIDKQAWRSHTLSSLSCKIPLLCFRCRWITPTQASRPPARPCTTSR